MRNTIYCALTATIFLGGCATLQFDNHQKIAEHNQKFTELLEPTNKSQIHDGAAPLEIVPLPEEQQIALERAWLRNKKVTYLPKNQVLANEVLKLFRQNGINITSALPLDTYFYNGNGVKNADGETALQLILGQMGLDYETNEKGQYVTVVPMKSKSWNINLGYRISHSSNTSFDSMCQISTGQNSGGGNASTTGGNSANTGSAGSGATSTGSTAQSSQNAASKAGMPGGTGQSGTSISGNSSVSTEENFWQSMDRELAQRVQILLPVHNAATAHPGANPTVPHLGGNAFAGAPQPQAMAFSSSSDIYKKQTVGHYSINATTGAITVQAPAWMLKQIDTYMQDILRKYNTSMTFEGIVVNVRANTDKSAGFDLSALASFAGKYGVVMTNNVLGGISLGATAANIPTASYGNAGTLPGGGAALGLISQRDNMQIFNAFLSTIGGTEILNRPVVTVTSGVPVDFGRLTPIYTNERSQTLAAGNVNSNAMATIQNNFIEHKYGSLLRIMPYYDHKTRRVRAQISLLQRPLVGFQNMTLSLMGANGSIQNEIIRKPQIECSVTSTEALLDDGELIIIGGQIENVADISQSGITGLMDVKGLEYLTSQRRDNATRITMYFALRVRLTNKPI